MGRADFKLCACCASLSVMLTIVFASSLTCDVPSCPAPRSDCPVQVVIDIRPGRECCKVCPPSFMEKCGYSIGAICPNSASTGSSKFECGEWGTHKKVREENSTGYCLRRSCSKNCEKIREDITCGSDGQYYRNPCSLRKRYCYSNITVSKESDQSKCDSRCERVRCGEGQKCIAGRCACRPITECHQDYHPVCGSDNNTYRSLCHLQVMSCNNADLQLKMVADGSCPPESSGEAVV